MSPPPPTVPDSSQRYLDLLKASLLNLHHLEHEIRIDYLLGCLQVGKAPDPDTVRDPARAMPGKMYELRQARRAGLLRSPDGDLLAHLPHTFMGRVRMDHLADTLADVRARGVPGDAADVGVDGGGAAVLMKGFFEAFGASDRTVWVADRFRSTAGDDLDPDLLDGGMTELGWDLSRVRETFLDFGLLDDRVRFLSGRVEDTLPEAPIEQLALLRIGNGVSCDAVLTSLYHRVADGGVVIVDTVDPAELAAVEAFCAERAIAPLTRIDEVARTWQKSDSAETPAAVREIVGSIPPERAPLADPAPLDAIDLTVVVIFYNMAREARRTLHSLSRSYQRGVADVDYEVIVVENGSDESHVLGAEFVRSFGDDFSYVDLGSDATPSPVPALNEGIRRGRGRNFLLLIDGAHVVTPGLIREGLRGLALHDPAVVATQQWYVGPGQQGEAMHLGYDQAREDELFDNIEWPSDGYRLFEISHFIGDRDWLDGVWETNALFVPRALLEQVGMFEENFAMAGGGYANLELLERLCTPVGVELVSILGEGSFHQVHGGTTTNERDADERHTKVFGYGEHFRQLRGRGFQGPNKPVRYIGHLSTPAAHRSRARRLSAKMFVTKSDRDLDGVPDEPSPIPDDLRLDFTEAFWRGLTWKDATWLGRRVQKAPTDLWALQELIFEVRPDVIVETNPRNGGRTGFLATICDLIGHGEVLSIARGSASGRPESERITWIEDNPLSDAALRAVAEAVGTDRRAMVVFGAPTSRAAAMRLFDAYAPFVAIGSYVVIEDTIVNGHPVWPSFGAGPAEAVRQIMSTRTDFVSDPRAERFGLTFNPGGFLRRVSAADPDSTA